MTQTHWTHEVHQLSEGYSAIVYDEHGQSIADHLSEKRARLIAAAPDMLAALREALRAAPAPLPLWAKNVRAAIARATGEG